MSNETQILAAIRECGKFIKVGYQNHQEKKNATREQQILKVDSGLWTNPAVCGKARFKPGLAALQKGKRRPGVRGEGAEGGGGFVLNNSYTIH